MSEEKFSRAFLKIVVHDNRVEIRSGMFPTAKKTIIPYRNIASVEVSSITKQLVISTNDNKKHKYALGGLGKAQACRDAIAARL